MIKIRDIKSKWRMLFCFIVHTVGCGITRINYIIICIIDIVLISYFFDKIWFAYNRNLTPIATNIDSVIPLLANISID